MDQNNFYVLALLHRYIVQIFSHMGRCRESRDRKKREKARNVIGDKREFESDGKENRCERISIV